MNTSTFRAETPESKTTPDLLHQDGPQSPDQFFRISKIVSDPEMLQGWFEWFKLRNIPCAITRGSGGYSLWRSGEEIGGGKPLTLTLLRKRGIVDSFGLTFAGAISEPRGRESAPAVFG